MAQLDLAERLRSLSFPGASIFGLATAVAELDSSPISSAPSLSHPDLPPSPGASRSHDESLAEANHPPAWERPSMFRATSYPASSADSRVEDGEDSTSFALGQRSPGANLPLPTEIRSRDSSPAGEACTPRRGKLGLDPWGLTSSRAAALMNPAQETTRDSELTQDQASNVNTTVKSLQGKMLKSALKGAQSEGPSKSKVPGRRVRFNKKVQVRQPKVIFVDDDAL